MGRIKRANMYKQNIYEQDIAKQKLEMSGHAF